MAVDPCLSDSEARGPIQLRTIGLNIGEDSGADGLSDEETSASDTEGMIPFGRVNADGHLSSSSSRPAALRQGDDEVADTPEDEELAAERRRQERMAARVASFVKGMEAEQMEVPMPAVEGAEGQCDDRCRQDPNRGACAEGPPGVPAPRWPPSEARRTGVDDGQQRSGQQQAYPPYSAGAPVPVPSSESPLYPGEEARLLGPGEAPGRFSLRGLLLSPWLQQRNAEAAQ